MRRTVWCAVALLLATAACGGSDKDTAAEKDDTAAATAISSFFSDQGMDSGQARCLGQQLVDKVGVAHLKDIEVLDAKLEAQDPLREFTAFTSTADSKAAAEIVVDCVGVEGVMKDQYQGIDEHHGALPGHGLRSRPDGRVHGGRAPR